MESATRKNEATASQPAQRASAHTPKKAKITVLLITGDDTLWPQIGAHLSSEMVLKQVDSIDELLTTTPSAHAAIVLWDARGQTAAAPMLSRLQLHSSCFAVVALDDAGAAAGWEGPIALRQIIAQIAVPVLPHELREALDSGREEVNARTALLGGATSDAAMPGAAMPGAASQRTATVSSPTRPLPWLPAAIIAGVLIGSVIAFLLIRHTDTVAKPAPPASPAPAPAAAKATAAADEKVDLLIEQAQQAMLERHFIDPADSSALTLYRRALALDPDNGEAHQGLQRLAEILIARVQSALDEHKFDVALQALESARSIDPDDGRLTALDERMTSLRAELGPAQILAAINAQNYDRAGQLIDEATRAKTLNNAKLAQLRDELRRRHDEARAANFAKLIDMRLQQDKLTEPRNDSAVYYLTQARAAGVAAELQPQIQEVYKRLLQSTHNAIDQRRFGDADKLLGDLRTVGATAAALASLQHDLNAARTQQPAAAPEQQSSLDLGQSRLAQGKVTEPDNDSAQLKQASPGMPEVAEGSLTRIKGIQLDYPLDALRKKIEGWVELDYVVTSDGKVASIKVSASNPAGVFDSAAVRALSRARYKPALQGGKPGAVSTKIRIAFKMSK